MPPLPAHNQELVLGHVTFVLQQLFQISLERGFCFNHRIERLFTAAGKSSASMFCHFKFFPCHCLAPNALTKLKVSSPQRTGRRLFCGNETTFFAVTTSASAMRVLRAPRSIASGSEGGDLCCRKGLRSKNDLDVKEIVIFGPEGSAASQCWAGAGMNP